MMSDLDQDIARIPRSREENREQEVFHWERTGKAFHITKEIVEKEAMYEEVDERYQEKRMRMLQTQNMQSEEQAQHHLLAEFAARAKNSGLAASSIANRRASLAPRASVDEASRKTSLDLTNLRSPLPHSMDPDSLTSPAMTTDECVMSPLTISFEGAQSYMPYESPTGSPYFNMMTTRASSGHVPAYVTQAPTPFWNQPQIAPTWAMQQHVPTPDHAPTDFSAVHVCLNHAYAPFRDYLASVPEFPITHTIPQSPAFHPHHPTASISGPNGHSRGHSQPSNPFHNLHLLMQGTHLAQTPMAVSSNSSLKIESPTETQSTMDFCPTPNTPLLPVAVFAQPAKNKDGVMVLDEELDLDLSEFSQFALELHENSSLQDLEQFEFKDFINLDELATISC
ncbi:hypothetical protein N7451_012442 [Penicillium sp. IBT 35674x]|nr:hypothetical protein N7451_012442 [Penicillium sp. IBT 35674x]